jgi:WD40 repeat protein
VYLTFDRESETSSVRVASLDGSIDMELVLSDHQPMFSEGHLLYAEENTLIAQPFDAGKLELFGDRRVLAEPISDYAVSDEGSLVYLEEQPSSGSQLTGYDREGRVQSSVFSPNRLDDIAISPDGGRLALMRVELDKRSNYDVWTYDLSRGVFTRVTFAQQADDPVWSPDGEWLIYAHDAKLRRIRASGAGDPEPVLDSGQDDVTHDWSRDGRQILFSRWAEGDQIDLWSLELGAGAEPSPVLNSAFSEFQAEFSPDGRWLAYASDESGELQVYVMSWPDPTGKWQVSTAGGGMPRWRGDGRELFYIALDRKLTAVEVAGDASGFKVGTERSLFQTRIPEPDSRSHDYVVTPDGDLFLFLERPPNDEVERTAITLIQEFLNSPEGG